MGQRSAEALARRAAKRGRSVEDQIKAERESDAKRAAQSSEAAMPEAATTAAPAPAPADIPADIPADVAVGKAVWKLDDLPEGTVLKKKDEKAGWMCMGRPGQRCGFINFPHRTTCKECGATRLHIDGAKKSSPAKPPRGGQGRQPPPRQAPTSASAPSEAGASTQWEGTNLAGAAEANATLRARYRDDPDSLDEAERARAEQLLARDARKRASKDVRRAAKSHAESVVGGGGKGAKGAGKGKGAGGGRGGAAGRGGRAGPGVLSTTRGPAPGAG